MVGEVGGGAVVVVGASVVAGAADVDGNVTAGAEVVGAAVVGSVVGAAVVVMTAVVAASFVFLGAESPTMSTNSRKSPQHASRLTTTLLTPLFVGTAGGL